VWPNIILQDYDIYAAAWHYLSWLCMYEITIAIVSRHPTMTSHESALGMRLGLMESVYPTSIVSPGVWLVLSRWKFSFSAWCGYTPAQLSQ
jgi:hypothetical protein